MEQLPAIITKARARLLVRAPFIGSISLGLAWVNAPDIGTMATDGRSVWFNPEWCERHGVEKTMGVIAHEVLHVVNRHHLRRGEREACLIGTAVMQGCRPKPSTRACSNSSSSSRKRLNGRTTDGHRARRTVRAMVTIRPHQVRQAVSPSRIRERRIAATARTRHDTGVRSAT
jgi:hypothetical protein